MLRLFDLPEVAHVVVTVFGDLPGELHRSLAVFTVVVVAGGFLLLVGAGLEVAGAVVGLLFGRLGEEFACLVDGGLQEVPLVVPLFNPVAPRIGYESEVGGLSGIAMYLS